MKFNCGICAICNAKIYRQWFGDPTKKVKRRPHEVVILEQRRKAEAIRNRKELNTKLKIEREARRQSRVEG